MNIRPATIKDAGKVQELIAQLGFIHSLDFIQTKLQKLLDSPNDIVLVAEDHEAVQGLITLHFALQLGFEGDIMTIGYLVVDQAYRGLGVGGRLEEYASLIAQKRKCSLIEVYSQAKRTDAHRFYERQGYGVAEKFFSKTLEA